MQVSSDQDRSQRRGKVAVLVGLSMPTLLGMSAFALDGGILLAERRQAQSVADSSALAGAIDMYKRYPTNQGVDANGTARMVALANAAANGYTNDQTNSVVTVNIPPQSGRFAGRTGHVEVLVQAHRPRLFSALWGSDRHPVSARAVARGMWEPPGFGVLTLHPTLSAATDSNGNGGVTINGGGVITNSNNSSGLRVTGNGQMQATHFNVTGNYVGSNFSATPTPGIPATPDPLRYLPEPSKPANQGTITKNGNNYTISPGWFPRNGQGALPNFTGGTNPDIVTFLPGLYYLEGGLTATGATLTGTGVMFFNAPTSTSQNANINISGGTVTLTPMTSGTYEGITFFQARNAAQSLNISGGGNFNIDGTFYAPNAELKITGSDGTARIGSQYISRTLALGGNGSIYVDTTGEKANERLLYLVE